MGMAAKQMTDFLEHGIIRNSVNFPKCEPPRLSQGGSKEITRMLIVNANEPGLLAEITTVFGDFKCNIVQHMNVSRGNIAYNVVDMEEFPQHPRDLQKALGNVKGVRSSRIMVGDAGSHFCVVDNDGQMSYQ